MNKYFDNVAQQLLPLIGLCFLIVFILAINTFASSSNNQKILSLNKTKPIKTISQPINSTPSPTIIPTSVPKFNSIPTLTPTSTNTQLASTAENTYLKNENEHDKKNESDENQKEESEEED